MSRNPRRDLIAKRRRRKRAMRVRRWVVTASWPPIFYINPKVSVAMIGAFTGI